MDRRNFIKIGAAGMSTLVLASGKDLLAGPQRKNSANMGTGDDYSISSDVTKDGIRYITAVPSAIVCSKKIEIQIEVKTKKIQSVVFFRGCDGNAKGIGALLKGMTTDEAIKRLSGIGCAGRATSCPDQFSRIINSLKW